MISDYLVAKAVEYQVIEPNDTELYRVSFSTMLFSALNWSTLLVMGLLLRCEIGCLIFMAFYIPLRIFSGGLHLATKRRCYCFSVFVFSLMIAIFRLSLYDSVVYDIMLIVSFPLIAVLSPGEDRNKPLSESEKRRNKKIVFFILIIEATALIIAKGIGAGPEAFFFISFAQVLMLFQLVSGKIRNSYDLRKNCEYPPQ